MTRKLFWQVVYIFSLISVLLVLTSQSVCAQKINYGDKAKVSGLVYEEYFYDLYNYGESPNKDQIIGVCMLKPDNELIVSGKNIYQLHMINNLDVFKCSRLTGHRVSVSGNVDEVHTGHHHGDALFFVKNVEILR